MIFRRNKNNRILYSADYIFINNTHKKRYGILTENGKILETGKRDIIKEQFPFTKEIKFEGAIYPGFIDSHLHLNDLAKIINGIDARNFSSVKDIENAIKISDKSEVKIYNFDFNNATNTDWGELFEKFDKPVFITSRDEHSVFINKALIEKHGITINNAKGGIVQRINGKFTGILKDRAIDNVKDIVNSPVSKPELQKAIDYLLSMGIVGITNFDYSVSDLLQGESENKNLKIRVFQGIKCEELDEAIKNSLKTGKGNEFFRIGPVKCFLDGSLGSQTALMNEEVGFKGVNTLEQKEFEEITEKANKNGIQVAVHAIGSKAVDIALHAFLKFGTPEMRNRIEHMQFISEDRLQLLEETNFIASMQPTHYKYDKPLLEKYGLKNYPHAYDWHFLISLNKTIAFGSDAPITEPNVTEGIYTAIFREEGKDISLKDAIKCYTENSARANFYEKEGGRIIQNMNADFTVLNKPLTKDFNFERVKTIATIIKGESVWRK